jgi:hypothetical protein
VHILRVAVNLFILRIKFPQTDSETQMLVLQLSHNLLPMKDPELESKALEF